MRPAARARTAGLHQPYTASRCDCAPPCLSTNSGLRVALFVLWLTITGHLGKVYDVKARALIDGANLDPQTFTAVTTAFDSAWDEVAPQAIEAARLRLAETVLRLASNGSPDTRALTDAAVRATLHLPTEL